MTIFFGQLKKAPKNFLLKSGTFQVKNGTFKPKSGTFQVKVVLFEPKSGTFLGNKSGTFGTKSGTFGRLFRPGTGQKKMVLLRENFGFFWLKKWYFFG